MDYTYQDVNPTLIENTTMRLRLNDGIPQSYWITPNDGYVLHDKNYDMPVLDKKTLKETGEVILGYRTNTATCGANYDFVANAREFYAVLESEVPPEEEKVTQAQEEVDGNNS